MGPTAESRRKWVKNFLPPFPIPNPNIPRLELRSLHRYQSLFIRRECERNDGAVGYLNRKNGNLLSRLHVKDNGKIGAITSRAHGEEFSSARKAQWCPLLAPFNERFNLSRCPHLTSFNE